uniref:Uncharacterized protein n=1 Tax=Avena sativa TaxID=4498 RepID=A0ACD5TSQ4_AVESA
MKIIDLVGLLPLYCILLLCAVPPARAHIQGEAEALVSWKASLASADEILGSWSLANSASLCRWPRITCDLEVGHITELDLLDVSLNGTLDELDFSAFPHLKKLRLDNNGLHGTIPTGIGNLTSLVTLRIMDNPNLRGTIPHSIGQLTHLTILYLDILGLDSTIPQEIGNLTSLEELHMSSVKLTGSIPRTIGMLKKLRWLLLQGNNLNGSIPLEIQNMTQLQTIVFSDNYLEGHLPSSIAHLMKLQFLDVSSNQLRGHIVPELGNSSLLDEVYIGNNIFSGTFPSSICVGGAMKRVGAYYNGFTSIHQQTFQNCTALQLVELTANNIVAELRD